jgi:DNA-binding CsgD family transcriptional regulator
LRHEAAISVGRDALDRLTETELRVLRAVGLGLSSKEIAHEQGIAPATVDVHVRNIMAKIRVDKRAVLVRLAVEISLVPRIFHP